MPTSPAYEQAQQVLALSPQERFLYEHHLNNLAGDGKLLRPNGDISTVSQAIVTNPSGRYTNIPTIWDGQELPIDQAWERAAKAGWHNWPTYDNPDTADARYNQMHQFIDADTSMFFSQDLANKWGF